VRVVVPPRLERATRDTRVASRLAGARVDGGLRAPPRASSASRFRRCARIRSFTDGCEMQATRRIAPWQGGHASLSTSKSRCRSDAHQAGRVGGRDTWASALLAKAACWATSAGEARVAEPMCGSGWVSGAPVTVPCRAFTRPSPRFGMVCVATTPHWIAAPSDVRPEFAPCRARMRSSPRGPRTCVPRAALCPDELLPPTPELASMRPARRRCLCGPLLRRPELVRYRPELVLSRPELVLSRGNWPTSAGARRVCRGVPPMCCPRLRRLPPALLLCAPTAVIVAHEWVVVWARTPGVRRGRRPARPELALCTRVWSTVRAGTLPCALELRTMRRVSVGC
jgi:hypothetical protein